MKIREKINKLKEKIPFRKVLPLLAIVIVLVLIYLSKSLFIAATVNGQPIWRLSLTQELEKQAGQKVLESMVTKNLVLQEAKKQNVSIGQEEINQAVKELEDELTKQGSNLDQVLAMQGLSKKDLEEQIFMRKVVEKILLKEVTVTDEEIKDYFEKNKTAFGDNPTLENSREAVKKQVEQEKLNEKIQTWLETLQNNAKINYFVQF